MKDVCQAVRANGQQCRGTARPSGFCFAHDPDLQEARAIGASLGGQNRATVARVTRLVPKDMQGVLQTLLTAFEETYSGAMEPKRATALASLAGAVVRLYEVAELEQRLERLERMNGPQVG